MIEFEKKKVAIEFSLENILIFRMPAGEREVVQMVLRNIQGDPNNILLIDPTNTFTQFVLFFTSLIAENTKALLTLPYLWFPSERPLKIY